MTGVKLFLLKLNFYPRPPCGGRRVTGDGKDGPIGIFLSTPSLRRATRRARAS